METSITKSWEPERGALMPCDNSRAQQEGETLLFFPGKDSANEESWTLFIIALPAPFFLSVKVFSFSCCAGTCTWFTIVADPKLQFSADP